jgi:hypothetical protein
MGKVAMTIMLITALQAAQTLAVFHSERVQQTLGANQDYHRGVARLCEADAERIKYTLAHGGVSAESQANLLRQRDVGAAQVIIAKHVLPKWRPSDKGPKALEALTQDIVNALQVARGVPE